MEWKELTQVTSGAPFVVERVRIRSSGIAVEGEFDPPPLAQLPVADQLFIVAFVRSHGSIKEMERIFGVSYPTIKARLNRLSEQLGPAVAIEELTPREQAPPCKEQPARGAILDKLERGEISVEQALQELER